ncbi:unnamed protein product [Gongylonema pulchrum]|uniref:O-antigen ligase family protein n=1 Tax=Gongylonema pulchrum TaxID=637853 RepID=A0A183CZI6_9BILA|nr:unnamed protein product [Gongylonema pulchrum]
MLDVLNRRNNDRKLVETTVFATVLFIILASRIKRRVAYINLLFLATVFTTLCWYSFRVSVAVWSLPVLLYSRFFDGTDQRYHLLQFWVICVCATLLFCFIVNHSSHSTTVHRKFFHLTVSLVCVTGIQYDFELIWLSAWLMLCVFAIVEASSEILKFVHFVFFFQRSLNVCSCNHARVKAHCPIGWLLLNSTHQFVVPARK